MLLIDERPEEATAWREALPEAEIAIATADLARDDQVRARRARAGAARRLVEADTDVVMVVDSLSRLAGGRREVAEVKRLFGSGRELARRAPDR